MMIEPAQNTNILADIWLEASLAAHDFIPASYWENNYEAMRTDYLTRTENYIWRDTDSGDITGFIALNGEHIEALFVRPVHQGRGVGKGLLGHARSIRARLTLNVYEENRKSVGFYRAMGFVETGKGEDQATGCIELKMIYPAQ